MSDVFGKRGRSWHISAVINRATEESKHEAECFVHIFNNCTQHSFEDLSIIEDLLQGQTGVSPCEFSLTPIG